MADDKKYYYIRLKENFFDSPELIAVESMNNGYIYSNILLKLYLKSLRFDGKLMITERIPYTPDVLASVTRHSVGDVKEALKVFSELELIEILDTGAIYMLDIQDFVGQTTTESDRKRAYRNRIDREKTGQSFLIEDKCPDKSLDKFPPEIRDKSLDIKVKSLEKKKKDIVGQEKPDSIPFVEITDYLNHKTGKNYKASANGNVKLIKARWNEGYKLEDFKQVIDVKTGEWLNNPEMSKYLQPSTLFGNKFDQYLNQQQKPSAPKNDSVKYDIKQSEFFTMPEGYSFDD